MAASTRNHDAMTRHPDAPTRYFDAFTGIPLPAPPPGAWNLAPDAPVGIVGPALFDPQVNGFAGVDFQDSVITRDQLEHAVNELRRAGCAHLLITLITASADQLDSQFARLSDHIAGSALLREAVLGFHLEGPFINAEPGYRGAHPAEHIRPADAALFGKWQRAAKGRIRVVTVAPECDGAIDFIRAVTGDGVFVSLGHSNASSQQLADAVAAGARMFTHLGNAAPVTMHRYDNIIQRVLAIPDLLVSLIPDGLHVPPPALGNVVRLLGPTRTVMTTDAASPAAAPPGRYRLGPLELEVAADGIVRLPGGDQYAGSSLTPARGLYNCIRYGGMSIDGAWQAWTRLRTLLFPDVQPPAIILPLGSD